FLVVNCIHGEVGAARSEATSESAQEAVRTEDGEIVRSSAAGSETVRSFVPCAHGVGPWPGLAVAGAHLKDRSGLAGVPEEKLDASVGSLYFSFEMQLIRQRACRTRAGLLLRQFLVGRRSGHVIGITVLVGRSIGGGVGQGNDCVVWRREVERRSQVAGNRAAPCGDVRLEDPEAALEEADQRGVIKHLGVDPPTLAPRRD